MPDFMRMSISFEVVYVEEKDLPKPNIEVVNISGDLTGCRIGLMLEEVTVRLVLLSMEYLFIVKK